MFHYSFTLLHLYHYYIIFQFKKFVKTPLKNDFPIKLYFCPENTTFTLRIQKVNYNAQK